MRRFLPFLTDRRRQPDPMRRLKPALEKASNTPSGFVEALQNMDARLAEIEKSLWQLLGLSGRRAKEKNCIDDALNCLVELKSLNEYLRK